MPSSAPAGKIEHLRDSFDHHAVDCEKLDSVLLHLQSSKDNYIDLESNNVMSISILIYTSHSRTAGLALQCRILAPRHAQEVELWLSQTQPWHATHHLIPSHESPGVFNHTAAGHEASSGGPTDNADGFCKTIYGHIAHAAGPDARNGAMQRFTSGRPADKYVMGCWHPCLSL